MLRLFVHESKGVGQLHGAGKMEGCFKVVDDKGGVRVGDTNSVEVALGDLDKGGFVRGVVTGEQ